MNTYAPILVSVLDRDVHFKKCVTSLAKNKFADKTHLFIALDAPFAEKHKAGYNKVLSFINTISEFKEVTLFKREKNLGSSRNQFLAMDDIFKQYDRLIFTEDDNIFARNFLSFINKGLDKFNDDESIFSVCGYNFPFQIPANYHHNYYAWKGWNAWGTGLWKKKWQKVEFSLDYIKNNLASRESIKKMNSIAGHYYPACQKMIETGHITDDGLISLYIINNDMFSVFPTVSKVKNFGMDGSGEHCGNIENDPYARQIMDTQLHFDYTENVDKENNEIYGALKKHFRIPLIKRLKMFIKRNLTFLI